MKITQVLFTIVRFDDFFQASKTYNRFLQKSIKSTKILLPLATCLRIWNGIRGYKEGFEVFVGPQNRTCRRRKWSDHSQNRHQYICNRFKNRLTKMRKCNSEQNSKFSSQCNQWKVDKNKPAFQHTHKTCFRIGKSIPVPASNWSPIAAKHWVQSKQNRVETAFSQAKLPTLKDSILSLNFRAKIEIRQFLTEEIWKISSKYR